MFPTPLRTFLLLAAASAIGGASSANVMRLGTADATRPPLRLIWVDYDLPPAHKVFEEFSTHFRAQESRLSQPVDLQFRGAHPPDQNLLHEEMRKVIEEHPQVIVATSVNVAQSLQRQRSSIPVFFISSYDPVHDGLVRSLIDTGPLTGYTYFMPMESKVFELMHRLFPQGRTLGVVSDGWWYGDRSIEVDLSALGRSYGFNVEVFLAETENDLKQLHEDPRFGKVDVWWAPYGTLSFKEGQAIVDALSATGRPAVYSRRKFLKMGGLMSVDPVDDDAMDVWAKTTINLLNGVPASRIPVTRPKEIEIAVNAKLAARLDAATRERIAREATLFE
jgi:ABC-type uncharacterized transport system substrate-binding protein